MSMKEVRNGFSMRDVEVRKHPTLDILCGVDGCIVYIPKKTNFSYRITYGTKTPHGYLTAWTGKKGSFIHRLVADTFIPNPENKPTVDHINRIRTDNRIENLRWATHREQRDNSSQVLEAKNFGGVRSCEDRKTYNNAEAKDWYKRHKEYRKEYMHNYYLQHKEGWNK